MPHDANGEINVRLGVLAHADVGSPGRQLVRHPAHGWVSVPVQRRTFGFATSRAGLGVVAAMGVMVLVFVAVLWRKPSVAMRGVTGHEASELVSSAPVAVAVMHPPTALAAASVVALNAASAVASNVEPATSALPSHGGGQRSSAGMLPARLPGGPRPEWAAAPGAGGAPRDLRTTTSSAESAEAAASAAPVRALRKPPRAVAPRSFSRGHDAAVAKAPSADATRRVPANEADAAQGLVTASSAASAPTSHVLFNEGTVPPAARADVLIAITDADTVVVPGTRGLPAPFRVGERLPSGARLLKVDPRGGEAQTDRGVIRLQ